MIGLGSTFKKIPVHAIGDLPHSVQSDLADPTPPKEDRRLSVKDMVNMPSHYGRFAIEPIRFIEENGLTPLQGKVVKYVVRYPFKNGEEDLRKARRCLDMLILKEQGDPDWWKAPERRDNHAET